MLPGGSRDPIGDLADEPADDDDGTHDGGDEGGGPAHGAASGPSASARSSTRKSSASASRAKIRPVDKGRTPSIFGNASKERFVALDADEGTDGVAGGGGGGEGGVLTLDSTIASPDHDVPDLEPHATERV